MNKKKIFVSLVAFVMICFLAHPVETPAAEGTGTWTEYNGAQYYTSDDLHVLAQYMSEQTSEYEPLVRICYEGGDLSAFQNVSLGGRSYQLFWNMVYAIDDADNLNDGFTLRYTRSSFSYSWQPADGRFYLDFSIGYCETKEQMLQANERIKEVVNKELKIGKTSGKTDYQKVKAIHDFICDTVTYDNYSSNYRAEYYGLFEPYRFVCQGYTVLFDKMCEEAGVTSYIMSGTGDDGRGNWGSHAWNFVKIEENWYFIDVTWDDAYWDAGKQYTQKYPYFLLDEAQFMKEHSPEAFFSGKEVYPAICVSPGYQVLNFASEKFQLTVSFDSQGGSAVESRKRGIEAKIGTLPEAPERRGYTFEGWYPDPEGTGERLTEDTRIYDHMTYYAKWGRNSIAAYTVSFDAQGGSAVASIVIEENDVPGSLPTPTREGYTFLGWYTSPSGGEAVTGNEKVTEDITYYAQWRKDTKTYTVSFDAQGGAAVASRTVAEGESVGTLPTPGREGYTFTGWYTQADGGNKITGNEVITENVTYYAQWSKNIVNYIVTFNPQGGSEVPPQTVAENGSVGSLPYTGRDGFTFTGWYTAANGGTRVTGSEVIMGNVTYYAQWSKNIISYTVSFDAQGGEPVASRTVAENGSIGLLQATSRSGYIFLGWYTAASGGVRVTGSEVITGDVTLYAQWSQLPVSYTVTFDAQGGTAVPSRTCGANESIGLLPETSRSGCTFLGWYTAASGGSRVTGSEVITGDVTYYAQWAGITQTRPNVYTVTFDAQGGNPVAPQTVTENGRLSYIPGTYRDGYIFMGWYTGISGYGSQLTGATTITNHTVYYAYWLAVSFTNNTGSVVNNTANTNGAVVWLGDEGAYIQVNAQVGLYESLQGYYPGKAGYNFKGWYLDAGLTQPVTKDTGLSNGMKIYARWEKINNWKLNKKKAVLTVGKTITLKIAGLSNSKITWKSMNPKLASVSAKGKVKAKKAGTVKIVAITEDGSVMSCKVVVKKKK